jgi:hypothetical protein
MAEVKKCLKSSIKDLTWRKNDTRLAQLQCSKPARPRRVSGVRRRQARRRFEQQPRVARGQFF